MLPLFRHRKRPGAALSEPASIPRWGDSRRTRIGLLGGSFNPAHPGHRHIAWVARRRLRLNQVWLMVSPGNPLKPVRGMHTLAHRLESARRIADARRIVATDIEVRLGTRYTRDTLALLARRFRRARFVWLMGADNLEQFPHWNHWLAIARTCVFAVLPRPTYNYPALSGQAAQRLRHARRTARLAPTLAELAPPTWIFLPASQHSASATAIRTAVSGVSNHPQEAPCTALAAG